MRRIGLLTVSLMLLATASAADVVVGRWGLAGRVQHPRTLSLTDTEEGKVAQFDLSAVPAKAAVYRARLLMQRKGGYGSSFEVFSAAADGKVAAGAKALAPAPPYCRWFDVTDPLRRMRKSDPKAAAFLIRGGGYDSRAIELEIAHEGALAQPPEQVKDLKAFCRAGQVFLTFREIEDLSEGQDRYPWGSLIKKLHGYGPDGPVPNDDKRELRYRVYRHDQPITARTIGDAELLAEVVPGSGFNTRIVQRIWQGENVPSKLDDEFVAVRLAVEPQKPLPSGVGVYVHTVRKAGKAWYAVVTAVNGVENTADLSAANVAGPVEQQVADPEPVLQQETFTKGAYNRTADDLITRRYVYWAVPPLAPRPLQYGFVMQWHPNRIAAPAALELSHGKGHTNEPELSRWQRRDAILLAGSADPSIGFYVGINNCQNTLKSFRQGTWAPWTYNRHAKLVEWARKAYRIDPQQIYCYGSHWGLWELRHPDIFSVFIGWGSGELTKGFVDWNRCQGVWGPPSEYAGKPAEENPYEACDFWKYVTADPARPLPVQFLIACTGSHTSEMSYPALPRYKRALMDARQPFASDIAKASWGTRTPIALQEYRAGRLKILRDQSKPAFGNCTLDDNPGCGDYADGDDYGMLNGYLLWETETITDEPGRWEMTVYLHDSAPLAACKVDLTPRHCQKFKLRPGAECKWTDTAGKDGAVIASGTVKADPHGLVTLRQIAVGKERNRIRIEAGR